MPSKKTILAAILSIGITFALAVSTWDMNFWPSDERSYYYEGAIKVPQLKYISEINKIIDSDLVKWLHGKEMFILACSLMQGVLNDYESVRPFVVVCVLGLGGALFLFYLTTKHYWGASVGFLCFGILSTSFWPYVYVLFVKHQPFGLFYVLFALYLLQAVEFTRWGRGLYFFSGIFLGTSIYSSNVSVLYFPFYAAAFLFQHLKSSSKTFGIKKFFSQTALDGLLIILGMIGALVYFNLPDVLYNLGSYLQYIKISGEYNHFYYNQPVLRQWMDADLIRRGGLMWVFKYFLLMMPVVFPFYLGCVGYLLRQCWINKSQGVTQWGKHCLMIALSLTPVVMAETKQVAQYGANYFPGLIACLFLIGYTLHVGLPRHLRVSQMVLQQKCFLIFLWFILGAHVIKNVYVFCDDVFPSRMVTTFLSKKIAASGAQQIFTYRNHLQRVNVVDNLNASLLKKIQVIFVDNIYQSPSGMMLVPPVSGNSIYIAVASNYSDYDKDIYVNELMRKGNIQDYAIASYKTLASSRIWPHEEEILSYRYLILNQFPEDDIKQGKDRVWLLDLDKLRRDLNQNKPSADYSNQVLHGIRNIGTKTRVYIYAGDMKRLTQPAVLNTFDVRIFKVGHPQDGLRAYIYKVDSKQPMWVPLNDAFSSDIVLADKITRDPQGEIVQFPFQKQQLLLPGPYQFVIYRTGKADDQNYYGIYLDNPSQIESYIKATARPNWN